VATKLTWSDLLIEPPELDPEILAHGWAWLVKGRFRAIAATKFGDWFLERPDGCVQMLDAIEGTLEQVASSHAEFQGLINTREKQEEWLLPELVFTLHEKGIVPARGECYSFKLRLVLGGKAVSDNVEVCALTLWVSISGQLHEQTQGFQRARGSRAFGQWSRDVPRSG